MNRRPTALRRALAVVLGLVVAGATAVLATPAAQAAPLVDVELTSVTVTGSRPSDEVEVRGRVSNPAGSQVYGLRMAMWRSRDPINELATVRQVATDSGQWGVILPSGYYKITEQGDQFTAGSVAEFVLHATLADLGFDTPGAVYAVGARALGTTDGGTGFGNVGHADTLLAIPGKQPVPVTRIVLLTAPPTKLTSGVFLNEDLATQLRGRLGTLLTTAASPGMSWLVDPALYDEVADMADGYQVQTAGSLVPGTGQSVAAEWLRRFQLLDRHSGGRTLFGAPDLTGAALAHDPAVLPRAVTATSQVTALKSLPLVVVPTAGVYTGDLAALPGVGDAPVLATNLVTAGALQPAPDGRTVLASAVSLGSGQPAFDARQLVLAETLVAAEAGQVRVLREPDDVTADTATSADWMVPRLLGDLLADDPAGPVAEFSEVSPATLTSRQFEAVADLAGDLTAYAELAPESALTDQSAAVLSRAVSTAWITDQEGHEAFLSAFDRLVGPTAMARAVTLDASSRFVMSARSNQFPLTVTNHLAEPIRVKVVVETDNPQRLTIPETPVVSVPAGQSATVTIQPEANGNGVAVARAWVATEDGQRVTPNTRIVIEMTEIGFIGWVIVVASAVVVVGATVFRIWQSRRKAKAAAPPAPDPSGAADDPAADRAAEPVSSVEHADG